MQVNDHEVIALLENNASWDTIRALFPSEIPAAKFIAVYFEETTKHRADAGHYRVTWKRVFRARPRNLADRIINTLVRRVEFEEVVFHTFHVPEPRAARSLGLKLTLCSLLRIGQMLICLVFSLGLLGVIGGYITLSVDEPPTVEDLHLFLIPIYVCTTALIAGIGMGLMARKITHDLAFEGISRYGFAPTNVDRL